MGEDYSRPDRCGDGPRGPTREEFAMRRALWGVVLLPVILVLLPLFATPTPPIQAARPFDTGTPDPDTPTVTVTPSATLTPQITPTDCLVYFTDVAPDNPFYTYIRCLTCRGIVSGYSASPPCTTGTPCYLPGGFLTRGQIAKFISNAADFTDPIPSTQQSFTDVPYGSPYWLYIERVVAHAIVGGYNAGCPAGNPCFLPYNNVTRGQTAKFVSNAAGFGDAIPSTQQTFSDVSYGTPFWVYIERAALHGVISGYASSPPCPAGQAPCFLPSNAVTRGQAAKLIANAFYPNCYTPGPTPTPTNTPSWTPTPTVTLTTQATPTNTPTRTPTPTPCVPTASASVSDPNPPQHANVTVYGHLACYGAGVQMDTTWHFHTVTSTCSGVTDANGDASCTRNIGSATLGYTVYIDVVFTLPGGGQVTTRTSFTPQ
jgi:hypothetical protein